MHLLKKPVLKYESAFYRTALSISIPVIISNLINIGLNMIDTIMIGKLGVLELSGVGAANRITFICSLMCFGFYGGMMIFVSQYWGAKDIKNIHRLLGVAYSCGIALCLCFMAISLIWPYQLMGLFGEDPRVIQHGVDFLRIVQISYLFSAVTFLLTCASRSIHRLLVPTIINTFALLFNVFFNYCLIFGKFGFPTWGVKGAAIATVGARLIEMILLLLYVYVLSKDHPLAAKFSMMFPFDKAYVKNLFKTTLPTLINEGIWSIGTSVYFIAFGKVNSSAIAVVQVASVVNDLFTAIFFGLGNASMVMIGNELGRKNTDLAYRYGKTFIKAGLVCSAFATVALIACRSAIVNIYDFDAFTNQQLMGTLLVYGLFIAPRMMGYATSIGVLRAGGDTRFCLICDIIGIWGLGIPLAFLGALVLHLSLPWVVALCFSEEIIKIFFFFHRFRSKRWINVLV